MSKCELTTIDIDGYREAGQSVWDLPPWNHPIGQGLFPLFLNLSSDRFIPIGTAFCVSHLGLVATATHCIEEAFKYEGSGRGYSRRKKRTLERTGLNILHHYQLEDGNTRLSLWPIENANGGMQGDVVFGFIPPLPGAPLLNIGLSPGIPRAHTVVKTIGYCEFKYPEGGIPRSAVDSGTFDWEHDYSHKLRVSEGTIDAIYLRRYLRGFGDGPCFQTNALTGHGQSGGPVIADNGYACGIHWSGLDELQGSAGSLASMIYPLLAIDIKTAFRFGDRVTFNTTNPLALLIATGAIRSDGTERLARMVRTPDGIRIDPMVHKDDQPFVYDDAHARAEGRSEFSEKRPDPDSDGPAP